MNTSPAPGHAVHPGVSWPRSFSQPRRFPVREPLAGVVAQHGSCLLEWVGSWGSKCSSARRAVKFLESATFTGM